MTRGHKKTCTQCFSVLSDGTRIRIIANLKKEQANVARLIKITGVTQPTVSHHLSILNTYGFVVKEKRGRETYYRFNDQYPCKGCGVFSAPIQLR